MDIIRFITDRSPVYHDTAARLVKLLHQCQSFGRFIDERCIQDNAEKTVALCIHQIMNRPYRKCHIVKSILECLQRIVAGESLDNHTFLKWQLLCQEFKILNLICYQNHIRMFLHQLADIFSKKKSFLPFSAKRLYF